MPSPVTDIFEMITRLTDGELTEMSGILLSTMDDMADNGDVAANLLSAPDLRDILRNAATGVMDGEQSHD